MAIEISNLGDDKFGYRIVDTSIYATVVPNILATPRVLEADAPEPGEASVVLDCVGLSFQRWDKGWRASGFEDYRTWESVARRAPLTLLMDGLRSLL